MIWFWIIDKSYQGLDDLLSLGGRLPVLSRDDGEADLALLVNIGVVDGGLEVNLRWLEGVLGWKLKVDQEGTLNKEIIA